MAEQKSRIYSLPEITEINDDMYLMLDASDTGARRFNLKTFYDKVDGVQASADAANTAATAATAAVDSANQAAQQAASAATSATTTVQGLVEDVNEAIEAVGDVTEQAVPLMSATTRGGAKLGTGLEVTDGTLSVNTVSSGDGSTAGPILSLDAKGWAEQDTTTGKNLLDANTFVQGGIDGNTGDVGINGARITSDWIRVESLADYTLQWPSGMKCEVYEYNADKSYNKRSVITWRTSPYAFSTGSGVSYVRVLVGDSSDVGISPSYANGKPIQLERGSTATAYEPYTGGTPSPSPDYPQEIRVARGRNLIDWDTVYAGKGSGGVFKGQVSQFNAIHIPATSEMVGKTVTFSARIAVPSDATNVRVVANVNGESAHGNYISKSTSGTSLVTVTPASTNDFFFISYGSGGSAVITVSDPQLEFGSTPTPYVPYGYVGMEAQSRNLFNPANFTGRTVNGITFTPNADGTVTANGTSTATATMFLMDYEDIRNTLSVGETYNIHGDTPSGVYIQYYTGPTSIRNTSFVVGEIVSSQNMVIYVQSGKTLNNVVIKPMLEKGSTPTPYQPYYHSTTPIPLPSRGWVASLPDETADVLTLDGAGKVAWSKACEEVTLNGSENWTPHSSNTATYFLNSLANGRIGTPQKAMCDSYLISTEAIAALPDKSVRYGASTSNALFIRDTTNGDTVENFKSWLSTHPVTVLYPLATPVTEERGYVEMPSIPVGAEISIPELDDLGVRYCVDTSALELARQWYGKAKSEYAEELMELRMTVNELATRVQ